MARRQKRLEQARNNPKHVSFMTVCLILKDHGFDIRSGGKGSHFIATRPGKRGRVTIPRRNPVKTVYVQLALEAIDEVLMEEAE